MDPVQARGTNAKRLLTGLVLVALVGCGGRSAPEHNGADVVGCYEGSGLGRALGATTGRAAAAQPTLVLDSVVEPGGKKRHARLALDGRARAASWEPAGGEALMLVVTGAYPPSLFVLRRQGRELSGTARLESEFPGVTVDTTSWAVRLTHTACAPVLAELRTPDASRPPLPPALRTELVAMGDSDQAVRKRVIAKSFADTAAMLRMERMDSARTVRLQEIIRKWGWPDPSHAGQAAAEAAFLVLQHSPSTEFQRSMLPLLDTLARVGEVSGQNIALLTDRVLKYRGLPQRYGTQVDFKNGTAVLYPIEDSTEVGARRAALGLMPLALYVRFVRRMYHAAPEPKPSGTAGHLR